MERYSVPHTIHVMRTEFSRFWLGNASGRDSLEYASISNWINHHIEIKRVDNYGMLL